MISIVQKILALFIASFLVFLTACQEDKINNVETPENTIYYQKDSSNLVLLFQRMLAYNAQETDSAIEEAKKIASNSNALKFVYHINLIKFQLLKGDRDNALHQIDSTINSFNHDTLNNKLGFYRNLKGIYFTISGDMTNAVAELEKGIRVFDANGSYKQSGVLLQNIVNTFFSQHDYQAAYKYCMRSRALLIKYNDDYHLPINAATCALCAGSIGKMEEADSLLIELKNTPSLHPLAKLLAEFANGEVEMLKKNYESAITHFLNTIHWSEEYKIKNVLLPTYASLLRAYVSVNEPQNAIVYGNKGLEIAQTGKNSDINYSLLKNLAYAYEQLGEDKKAFQLLKEAEELFRQSKVKNDQTEIQELLIKYEDEKKTNTILMQESSLNQQRFVIISLIALFCLLLLGYLWSKSIQKHKKLVAEKELQQNLLYAQIKGEEKERNRMADELHHGIASNLVAIKMQIENLPEEIQELANIKKALSVIRTTHNETRKIAHDLTVWDFKQQDFIEILTKFCKSCSTNDLNVYFHNSVDSFILEPDKTKVVYRGVQEFIQNAIKHAEASRVDVQLIDKGKEYLLTIEDDGKGFNANDAALKLSSVKAMIAKLEEFGFDCNIDTRPGSGTSIFIHILKSDS